LKLELLPEVFDYYSFGSRQALTRQVSEVSRFVCDIPGDYFLLVGDGMPAEATGEIADFEEVESDWWCIKIKGELLFSEIGIAADITGNLARASISVLVMSGYKTDYFFIKADDVEGAMACLREADHEFEYDVYDRS